MEVRDGSGMRWRVRRRWAPQLLGTESLGRRFRRRFSRVARRTADGADFAPDGCLDVVGEGFVAAIAVLLVVLLVLFVGVPLLFALGELVLVLLAAAAGAVARIVFRHPWTVDALADDGTHRTWRVVGWRAAGAARHVVADALAAGVEPALPA